MRLLCGNRCQHAETPARHRSSVLNDVKLSEIDNTDEQCRAGVSACRKCSSLSLFHSLPLSLFLSREHTSAYNVVRLPVRRRRRASFPISLSVLRKIPAASTQECIKSVTAPRRNLLSNPRGARTAREEARIKGCCSLSAVARLPRRRRRDDDRIAALCTAGDRLRGCV